MTNILTAENIAVAFSGRQVLNGVTIRAQTGKITGLLGRNGCGKSTLLKVVFGTQPATDKIIQYNDKTIRTPYTCPGLLNYLPQFPFFPKALKVLKALSEFRVEKEKILNCFPSLVKDLGKTFGELSGGEERLISMLILLYAPTKFTLLDEPFTHIMPLHIDKLKEVLTQEKQNKGILLTDHMYRHLTAISDITYLIKEGRSLLIHTADDLAFHGYIRLDGQ